MRILKIGAYMQEAAMLKGALKASRVKIQIFLGSVLTIVLVMGSIMYIVEGPESGFTSIPRSMYWAIVTLTTVGYGDIAPVSDFGQFLAAIIMLLGYAIIAIPTGIVTSELTMAKNKSQRDHSAIHKICPGCEVQNHTIDATFCRICGTKLELLA